LEDGSEEEEERERERERKDSNNAGTENDQAHTSVWGRVVPLANCSRMSSSGGSARDAAPAASPLLAAIRIWYDINVLNYSFATALCGTTNQWTYCDTIRELQGRVLRHMWALECGRGIRERERERERTGS
jgi:hypothetical protein